MHRHGLSSFLFLLTQEEDVYYGTTKWGKKALVVSRKRNIIHKGESKQMDIKNPTMKPSESSSMDWQSNTLLHSHSHTRL